MSETRKRRVLSRSIRTLQHGCQKVMGELETVQLEGGIVETYLKIRCRFCKEMTSFRV